MSEFETTQSNTLETMLRDFALKRNDDKQKFQEIRAAVYPATECLAFVIGDEFDSFFNGNFMQWMEIKDKETFINSVCNLLNPAVQVLYKEVIQLCNYLLHTDKYLQEDCLPYCNECVRVLYHYVSERVFKELFDYTKLCQDSWWYYDDSPDTLQVADEIHAKMEELEAIVQTFVDSYQSSVCFPNKDAMLRNLKNTTSALFGSEFVNSHYEIWKECVSSQHMLRSVYVALNTEQALIYKGYISAIIVYTYVAFIYSNYDKGLSVFAKDFQDLVNKLCNVDTYFKDDENRFDEIKDTVKFECKKFVCYVVGLPNYDRFATDSYDDRKDLFDYLDYVSSCTQ